MTNKLAFADDHFHDECGVFGVFGHPEAANLAYLSRAYAVLSRSCENGGKFCGGDGDDAAGAAFVEEGVLGRTVGVQIYVCA